MISILADVCDVVVNFLLGEHKIKSKCQKYSISPIFNETLHFPWDEQAMLHIHIDDYDGQELIKSLGTLNVDLTTIDFSYGHVRKFKTVRLHDVPSGSITMNISYKPFKKIKSTANQTPIVPEATVQKRLAEPFLHRRPSSANSFLLSDSHGKRPSSAPSTFNVNVQAEKVNDCQEKKKTTKISVEVPKQEYLARENVLDFRKTSQEPLLGPKSKLKSINEIPHVNVFTPKVALRPLKEIFGVNSGNEEIKLNANMTRQKLTRLESPVRQGVHILHLGITMLIQKLSLIFISHS